MQFQFINLIPEGFIIAANGKDLKIHIQTVQLPDYPGNLAIAHAAAHNQDGILVLNVKEGSCFPGRHLLRELTEDGNTKRLQLLLRQAFLYCLPGQQLIGNNIVVQIGFLPEGMDCIIGYDAYSPCGVTLLPDLSHYLCCKDMGADNNIRLVFIQIGVQFPGQHGIGQLADRHLDIVSLQLFSQPVHPAVKGRRQLG